MSDFSRKNRVTCKESTLGQRVGAKIQSSINGIESEGIKSELSLDLFMRLERGFDGRWAIGWFEVIEVGPKVVQPLRPTGHIFNSSTSFKTAKPKSVWRPRHSQDVVNPAHCQRFKAEHVAQVLGAQVQKLMEVPLGMSVPRVLTSVEGQVCEFKWGWVDADECSRCSSDRKRSGDSG